jgi:hypothetical protein
VFPHLPVRRDAFILRVIDRYIAANISGVELQETEPVSRHKFRSRHEVPILNTWMDRNQVAALMAIVVVGVSVALISTLIPPNPSLSYLPKAWIGKEAIIIAKEKESNGKGKSNLAWFKPVSLSIIFTISLRMILVRCVLSGIIFYMYDSFCYVTVAIVELNRERVVLRLLDS